MLLRRIEQGQVRAERSAWLGEGGARVQSGALVKTTTQPGMALDESRGDDQFDAHTAGRLMEPHEEAPVETTGDGPAANHHVKASGMRNSDQARLNKFVDKQMMWDAAKQRKQHEYVRESNISA